MTVNESVVINGGNFAANAWKTRRFRPYCPYCQRLRFRYRSIDFHPLRDEGRVGGTGANDVWELSRRVHLVAEANGGSVPLCRSSAVNEQQMNPYLTMLLHRVRTDALHVVRLAREARRIRDPDGAARELGRIVERLTPVTKASVGNGP
jgi:hypothetical protein